MVNVFLGVVVSVVVLISSAIIPLVYSTAYAASGGVLLTHIQAGGVGAATQELVVIYNNSPDGVDISGWCLTNKSNIQFSCFHPPIPGQALFLPGYSYATTASESFATTMPGKVFTRTYIPTNQSSGNITGGSDTVSLIDHSGMLIDRHTWTSSLVAGMHLVRTSSGEPVTHIDTDGPSDWSIASAGVIPDDETEVDQTVTDVCPNIEGEQATIPFTKELNEAGECVDRVIIRLDITEVLPNAIGSDTGAEFIEIYNPNELAVDLSEYQLYVGPQLTDVYDFPIDSVIEPRQYRVFSNTDIAFSLLNTSSKVLLALKNGIVVSEMPAYEAPKDGQSWALIDGVWRYVLVPTPGTVNIVLAIDVIAETEHPTLQPCAANQYRSPETNRCRLIANAAGAVTPCKDGQYRSEETNRCRNIATDARAIVACDAGEERNPDTGRCRKIVAAAQPAPCKEGQERNPDTNRCRNVAKMPSAEYGVLGAKTDGGGNGYVIAAIGGVLLLAAAYAIWEWRVEIGKVWRRMYARIGGFVRIHK